MASICTLVTSLLLPTLYGIKFFSRMDPFDETLQRHFLFDQIVSFQASKDKFFWIEVGDPRHDRNLEFLFRTPLAGLIAEMIKVRVIRLYFH
jgi:hypothetical protein